MIASRRDTVRPWSRPAGAILPAGYRAAMARRLPPGPVSPMVRRALAAELPANPPSMPARPAEDRPR